eukprot:8776701-Alexandrium_andersonii.AAC.1
MQPGTGAALRLRAPELRNFRVWLAELPSGAQSSRGPGLRLPSLAAEAPDRSSAARLSFGRGTPELGLQNFRAGIAELP